jgi:hypothetical protein
MKSTSNLLDNDNDNDSIETHNLITQTPVIKLNGKKTNCCEEDFTNDLTKHFSMKNAKYVSIGLITFFIFYHGYLNSFYGKTRLIYYYYYYYYYYCDI